MNSPLAAPMDEGTGYGIAPRAYNRNLVEVGPGTPMGELMRRYWQPCFISEKLTSERPERVRLLGEDLILFRDKEGRPGLVHEHCCHRGSSLYYGRIEEDGIRCCYHGWKFDVKGRCLDQPAEVDGGRNRAKIRQPWYPVQERYGLVYAYMGPPEKKPVLPRWKHLEDLKDGEVIEVACREPGVDLNPPPGAYQMGTLPYNYLQMLENTQDAAHVPWLHYHHSGDQFGQVKLGEEPAELPPYALMKNLAGNMIVERTELGVTQGFPMAGPGGQYFMPTNETTVMNAAVISGFIDLLYIVAVDDTTLLPIAVWRSKYKGEHGHTLAEHGGKSWWDMTPEEHQRFPGDFEAQGSIGALPAHNWEHFSQSDRAIGIFRRRLEEAVRDVGEGRDPPGVAFDEAGALIETRARGFLPCDPPKYPS